MDGGNLALLIASILCFAPWAVYLAGIAKLTDVINDWNGAYYYKSGEFMLEWAQVWLQFAFIVALIVVAIGSVTHKAGFLQMWFATNTFLMIYSATLRITLINMIEDSNNENGEVGIYNDGDLDGLRCVAAGQVSTAAWNFVLAVFATIAGNVASRAESDKAKHGGQPVVETVATSAPATAPAIVG